MQNEQHKITAAPELMFERNEFNDISEILPIFAQWLAQHLGEPVHRDQQRTVWFGKAVNDQHKLFAPFRLEIEQEWGIGKIHCSPGDMMFIAEAIQKETLGQRFQDGAQLVLSPAPPEGFTVMGF